MIIVIIMVIIYLLGPAAWGDNFPDCNGDQNSPIDLTSSDAERSVVEPWELNGWNESSSWSVYDGNYTGMTIVSKLLKK